MANAFYSLHSIKLKLCIYLDYDVEHLWGLASIFLSARPSVHKLHFWLTPTTVYIPSSWNLVKRYPPPPPHTLTCQGRIMLPRAKILFSTFRKVADSKLYLASDKCAFLFPVLLLSSSTRHLISVLEYSEEEQLVICFLHTTWVNIQPNNQVFTGIWQTSQPDIPKNIDRVQKRKRPDPRTQILSLSNEFNWQWKETVSF